MIRRAAGLGRPSKLEDPDTYEKCYAFCDVLVIGGGPAGLMAALAAAETDARVIVCDEDFEFGGRLLTDKFEIDGAPAEAWRAAAVAKLAANPNVTLMPRSTVFGVYDGNTYGVIERVGDHLPVPAPHTPRQRFWKVVAKRSILAAGSVERPIVFGGNDKPGVMMASAVRTYVNRFGAAPMRRFAVFANNDDAWRTVADCAAAGVHVDAVIDSRKDLSPALKAIAEAAGARVYAGGQVLDAHGKRGVSAISVHGADGHHSRIEVDGVAVSGGWNPNIGLTCHLGARPVWRDDLAAFVGDNLPSGMVAVGSAKGSLSLAACLAEGAAEGAKAASDTGFSAKSVQVPSVAGTESTAMTPLFHVEAMKTKGFVDFQNDVTAKDIALAHRENYKSVEHLKRYTTLGMATDQGKTGNVQGLAMMAALTGKSIPETGITTFRPPYVPIAVGAFGGHHRGKNFRPTRLTPSHRWAVE